MSNRNTLARLLIATALGGVVCLSLFWLAGQISGLLTDGTWPASSIVDIGGIAARLFQHGFNPADAWPTVARAALGPMWLILLIFAALLVPLLALAFFVAVRWHSWVHRPEPRWRRRGYASFTEVDRLLSADAVRKKAKSVRPSMAKQKGVNPLQVGFFLGRDIRSMKKLYASVEDVFIVLAPPRQGKDVHFCAPFTIDAPGPCIVTSTRSDAFTNTVAMRSPHGRIHVFDPNGMTHWPERMRWSPINGCEAPMTAANRASAIILGSGFKIQGDSAYWVAVSISILRCYLHAAALSGRKLTDVMRWSTQPANPEPFTILRSYEDQGKAAGGWAGELESCATSDPKFRAIMWATLIQAMSCFSDPSVLEACSPEPHEEFNIAEFLAGRNTLYVLGKEKKNSSVAPIVTAMMEDIFDETRRIASRMPGSRLDPPLTVELNEAAHIAPLPSLPGYMGDSGGFSIALHVYLQSLSQARSRWGDHDAMIMWDNAAVRIIMGGAGNVDDLEDISRLMGDEREGIHQTTRSSNPGGKGVSVTTGRRPVLSATEIRTLKFGRAVLVARAARPVEMTLTPWWKRKDAARIGKGKAATEKLILGYVDEADRKLGRHGTQSVDVPAESTSPIQPVPLTDPTQLTEPNHLTAPPDPAVPARQAVEAHSHWANDSAVSRPGPGQPTVFALPAAHAPRRDAPRRPSGPA